MNVCDLIRSKVVAVSSVGTLTGIPALYKHVIEAMTNGLNEAGP